MKRGARFCLYASVMAAFMCAGTVSGAREKKKTPPAKAANEASDQTSTQQQGMFCAQLVATVYGPVCVDWRRSPQGVAPPPPPFLQQNVIEPKPEDSKQEGPKAKDKREKKK